MNIGIIIYAFMLADRLEQLLEHIVTESDATIYLFLHSQKPQVVGVCQHYARLHRTRYYAYGVNRGLARSFNDGLLSGYADGMDVMLTANDDMLPSPGDIHRIAQAAVENRDKWIVEGVKANGEHVMWALAAVNPIAIETVGYSDQNFIKAYYEDVDYRYRARLAGLEHLVVQDTCIDHIGSASIKEVPQEEHTDYFMKNQSYYHRKWGGEKGFEVYQRPFNDPRFDLKISSEARFAPYPGYNREEVPEAITG